MRASTWAAVALAASLAGCGGGSVGLGVGFWFGDDDRGRGRLDAVAETALLAVVAFDALAGPERLLAAFPGLPRPESPVGASATVACPAGGNVSAVRTAAGSYILGAASCRLRGDDPLRYSGDWRWTFLGNSYAASGTCPAGTTCRLEAQVDTSTAQFSYGSGPMQAVPGRWVQSTDATGVGSATLAASGAPLLLAGGGTLTLDGSIADLGVNLGRSPLRVRGDAARQALQLVGLPSGTLVPGARITGPLDADGNGVAERTLDLPWWWLTDYFD